MQELVEQTLDQLCCPLMLGCSMGTSLGLSFSMKWFSSLEDTVATSPNHVIDRLNVFVVASKYISWQQLIYKKRWRINTGLFIELWSSSDLPTILKWNQRFFFYHAAIVLKCNWIISFYNRLDAVVYRTFDLYCIIQKSVYEIKHVNKLADQITIPTVIENCLTAWSAAFRVIIKGWQSRNAIISSKVGFIMLQYHFVPVWVRICAPDLLRSPRDVEIFQWILEAFPQAGFKKPEDCCNQQDFILQQSVQDQKTTINICPL